MKLKSLAAALMLMAAPVAAQEVKVGIAAEPYPPFASPDASGNWVGWEVEIINAVCAAAEMQCVITPVAWDGIIPALTAGQIDAIMAGNKPPPPKDWIDSSKPKAGGTPDAGDATGPIGEPAPQT